MANIEKEPAGAPILRLDDGIVGAIADSYGIHAHFNGGALSFKIAPDFYKKSPGGIVPTVFTAACQDSSSYFSTFSEIALMYAEDSPAGLSNPATLEELSKDAAVQKYNSKVRGGKNKSYAEALFVDLSIPWETHVGSMDPREYQRLVSEFDELVKKIREIVRISLSNVLLDGGKKNLMQDEISRDPEMVEARSQAELAISHIRNRVERPDERKQFIQAVKAASAALGCHDIEVLLLGTRTYVDDFANGVYVPANSESYYHSANPDKKACLYVPMSRYTTRDLLPLQEVWEIVADLLAYHQIAQGSDKQFAVLSGDNMKKLQTLKVKLGIDSQGNGTFEVVTPEITGAETPEMDKSLVDMACQHAETINPKRPVQDLVHDEISGQPADDLVKAFMDQLCVVNKLYAHAVMHKNNLPPTSLFGSVQWGGNFVPPRRLWGDECAPLSLTESFWNDLSRMVFQTAQDNTFDIPGALEKLTSKVISNVYVSDATDNKGRFVYWGIDASTVESEAEIIAEQDALVHKLIERFRQGIIMVLSDVKKIGTYIKTARINNALVEKSAFRSQTERLSHIREQTEHPEEQVRFMDLLKQAVELLGYTDLNVNFLSVEDALLLGSAGLYKSGSRNHRAEVCIPMSHYGTTQLLEIDRIWETLAHEVAHHEMRKRRRDKDALHGVSHNVLTGQILRSLRSFDLDVEPDGTVILRKPENDKVSADPAKLKQTLAFMVEEAMKERLAAEAKTAVTEAIAGSTDKLHGAIQGELGEITGAAQRAVESAVANQPPPVTRSEVKAVVKATTGSLKTKVAENSRLLLTLKDKKRPPWWHFWRKKP